MDEDGMKALSDELSACVRTSLAHTPFPQVGSPSQVAVVELIRRNPIMAMTAMPQMMVAATEWGQSIQKFVMAYTMLGLKMDVIPAPQSPFIKNLFAKEDHNG